MNVFRIGRQKLLILSGSWTLICVISILEVITHIFMSPEDQLPGNPTGMPFIRLFSGLLGILLVIIPSYNLLKTQNQTIKIIGFIIGAIAFSLVYLSFFVALYQVYFYDFTFEAFTYVFPEIFLSNLHQGVVYYSFLLGILLIMDYFSERSDAMISKAEIEKELSLSKFQNLKNQMQPHFLFNAINSVVSIMDDKKEVAQNMLVDLSDLLRKSLDQDFSQKIKFEEEMQILNSYLNIEKNRFEDQLILKYEIDETVKEAMILPFILQPLAENAIRHGFSQGIKSINVLLKVMKEGSSLKIILANSGTPLDTYREGIGLTNLQARLKNEYGEQFKYEIYQNGEFVENFLMIPYETH